MPVYDFDTDRACSRPASSAADAGANGAQRDELAEPTLKLARI
jgi:hypothetical protein